MWKHTKPVTILFAAIVIIIAIVLLSIYVPPLFKVASQAERQAEVTRKYGPTLPSDLDLYGYVQTASLISTGKFQVIMTRQYSKNTFNATYIVLYNPSLANNTQDAIAATVFDTQQAAENYAMSDYNSATKAFSSPSTVNTNTVYNDSSAPLNIIQIDSLFS
jgi:hypothetical protein